MVVIILERFADKFYGTDSEFQLDALGDLQDVKCSISQNNNLDEVMRTHLMVVLQDEKLVAKLLVEKNTLHGDHALCGENGHYTLTWYTNFALKLQTSQSTEFDEIKIPNMEIYLLEFIKI
jgi:hypothetical protein